MLTVRKNTIILLILLTSLFDMLIASNSILPFRLIYDIAFMLILIPLLSISISLITQQEFFTQDDLITIVDQNFSKFVPFISLIVNLKSILSILMYDTPII